MDIITTVICGCVEFSVALQDVICRTTIAELCSNCFTSITGK